MRTYSPALRLPRKAALMAREARYLARHPTERKLIRDNDRFQGIHAGEDCFILGNGPSLIEDDLSVLADDVVFTVNNLTADDLGAGIYPRYHVLSDRRFFSLDPDSQVDAPMLATLRKIFVGDRSPVCFAPSSEAGFIRAHRLDTNGNVSYFCNPFYFSDYYVIRTDATRIIPRFCSVVQHAVLLAIHMGFQRIYLLGCDTTNIIANISAALNDNADKYYAYEVSPELNAWFSAQFAKRTMERCAESYLEVLIGFRFLWLYCVNTGVELVNCSSRSVVDSIPRRRLHDVRPN
ncbi:hypothetical protein [Lentzea sp. NPDC060358]|uniref:hypothetical protein n=1 Tax=Lentzea sp. NPDC060358 TaxID=3347103 RepID=UPI0036556B23